MSAFAYDCIDEGPWKYRLTQRCTYATGIFQHECQGVAGFIKMGGDGVLMLSKAYCWNGPSGPTLDTADSIRASAVHDALYQLIRQGDLPRKIYRKKADQLLREIALADHMPKWRAFYWYWGVRIGARRSSFPGGGSVKGR